MPLSDVAVMTTACWRPYYLEETLDAWSRVRGVNDVQRFCVSLGYSGKRNRQLRVIDDFRRKVSVPVEVREDNPPVGPWRAIGETTDYLFQNPETGFVICCDEDTLVADDVLELFDWAKETYKNDQRVLVVNAHSRCGQGWDGPSVKDDPGADETVVRLIAYFNAWGNGTWRDRWFKTIKPRWDYDGTSGTATQSGCDWNMHLRVIPSGDFVAVTPDASRTQHIGDLAGKFSNEQTLKWSKAASFKPSRRPVSFQAK
jgi:hypothetical protein